jgi:hypothetical protein
MASKWEEMMADPEVKAALASDPDTALLFADLMQDSQLGAASAGAADSSSRGSSSSKRKSSGAVPKQARARRA